MDFLHHFINWSPTFLRWLGNSLDSSLFPTLVFHTLTNMQFPCIQSGENIIFIPLAFGFCNLPKSSKVEQSILYLSGHHCTNLISLIIGWIMFFSLECRKTGNTKISLFSFFLQIKPKSHIKKTTGSCDTKYHHNTRWRWPSNNLEPGRNIS